MTEYAIIYAQGWVTLSGRFSGWSIHTSLDELNKYVSKGRKGSIDRGGWHQCRVPLEAQEDMCFEIMRSGVFWTELSSPPWLVGYREGDEAIFDYWEKQKKCIT